jgi:hypothetical protein
LEGNNLKTNKSLKPKGGKQMKNGITAITLALGLAFCSWTTLSAQDKDEQKEKVNLKDLPQTVQSTIQQQSQGGQIQEIEKETEKGQTYYEVTVKKNGQKEEFKVGLDGKYLGKETEKEGEHEKD